MKMPKTLWIVSVAAGLVLAGCGNGDSTASPGEVTNTATTPTEDTRAGEGNGSDTTLDDSRPTTTGESDGDGPGEVISVDNAVLSDGVWAVGEAGTVEFVVRDGGLELIEANANDGWEMSIDEQSPDEIEVDFEQGNQEYEIEIEYENGTLEIEIDRDIDPADPGAFDIGPAGVATISVAGGGVVLDDLAVTDGWSVTEQEADDGEVEIELRRDNVDWDFEAEMDDGRLEVEIDFEIEGQFP